ncbi:MAG: glycosyltransferase family 2 protein [Patescibacteria group bacterium]
MTNRHATIACTVAVLTRNSAQTLACALESVRDFAEIIVCDSGSTDETLAIAHTYGARVISQDPQFLEPDGRIKNFAGVRNQTLSAATNVWFLFLDSDEYLGQELREEVARVTEGEPGAFWIPRKYEHKGVIIDCSVAYPSQQMRLFHLSVAHTFIKEVHEKIELKKGIVPGWLNAAMIVPVPDTVEELRAKWRRYIEIERTRRTPTSVHAWIVPALKDVGIGARYALRLCILLFCRGTRLPVSYEWARVWYQCLLLKESFITINRV